MMNETKPAISNSQMDQVTDEIYRGNKLAAVKIYKESKGCSLLEAKEFVERLTDRLQQESPEKFQPGSATSGCASTILVAVATAAMGLGVGVVLKFLA